MGYFDAAATEGCGSDGDHCVIELNDGPDMIHHGAPPAAISSHANSNYSLSAAEMESLAALCDTFLPSVAATADGSAAVFFETAASATGTSQRVGEMVKKRLKHPNKWLMRVTIWMLSTWYGTYILCGNKSLSNHFPYFQTFPKVSQKRREQIVLSWSLSYFFLLRMWFRTIKIFCLFAFFTQVDEKMNNISWQAIDYPGADPQFKAKDKAKQQSEALNLKENGRSIELDEDEEELYGPLFKAIVNLEHQQVAASALRKFGFPVTLLSPMTKTSSPSMIIKCDAVVVGSGSGGGVVAGVLANAGYKVLVLEKGSYCARTNISLLEGPAMQEMYLSSGLVATDNMNVLVLAGSTVGGGSTVNWSASIQTPSHVTREWSDVYELELFSSSLYKEALEVVCKKMGVQSEIDNEGFNNAVLRKGCEELGYQAFNIPRNSTSDHYCGWCCLGCKDGRKKGTAETWLVNLVRTGNGAILPGCEAISIRKEKKRGSERDRAKGVAFEFGCGSGAKQMCLVESKVTIVACGALSTPPLLKRSGLKNPNIGKNLHLHPGRAFFSDHQAAMEKPRPSFAISCSVVAILTLTSFASCMAAESEAFKSGVVGLVCLAVAQIFGSAVICHGCWGKEKSKSCSAITPLLFISWLTFGIAMVLMSGATSMNRKQEYKKGWIEGECYVVKDGIFVGAALLVIVNGGFTIGSIAMSREALIDNLIFKLTTF